MALRQSRYHEEEYTLNLAPIMNVVMILIPLLLVTASFVVVATLNVNSPRSAQSVTPEEQDDQEEVPVPRVLIAVTEEGFTITDMRQSPAFAESLLGQPLSECGGTSAFDNAGGAVPVTICNAPNRVNESNLLNRLNYRGLYNRLVEIRVESAWAAQWDDDNSIVNIVADREIPFEVVVRVMDISRYFLQSDSYENDESFRTAVYREEGANEYIDLFPSPVLLLPRAAAN